MANGIHVGLDEILIHFEELEDPRSDINQRHPLESVVTIAVLAILAGAGGPTAIARWAGIKEEWLAKALPNGIPGKDVFWRGLSALQPEAFQACFASWLSSLRAQAAAASGEEQPVFAVNGKTLQRSHDRKKGLGALHSVSVWASEYGLTPAQIACAEKLNALFFLPSDRARRFPRHWSGSIFAERSSPSTQWGRRRPSRSRSSRAGPTTCWP